MCQCLCVPVCVCVRVRALVYFYLHANAFVWMCICQLRECRIVCTCFLSLRVCIYFTKVLWKCGLTFVNFVNIFVHSRALVHERLCVYMYASQWLPVVVCLILFL